MRITGARPERLPAALPRWAAVADAVVIALAVLACAVAIGGGIRWGIGPWRVSSGSPVRLALVAALVAAVRHWGVRHPTLHARIVDLLLAGWRSESVRVGLPIAIGSRAVVGAVGLIAVLAFGFPGGRPGFRVPGDEIANLYGRWDGGWYLDIAIYGYHYDPSFHQQQNIAFFPAFPLAMRAVAHVVGDAPRFVLASGVIVSWAAFAAALACLFALGRELPAVATRERATLALLLLASYPFAVFHGAAASESLFLLCAVGAFLSAHRGRWGWVAAFGVVAGLTRPNGFLLTLPLAVLLAEQHARRPRPGAAVIAGLLAAVLAPVAGMLLFSAFMNSVAGAPFEWASITERWGRTFGGPAALAAWVHDVHEAGVLGWLRGAWPTALDGAAAVLVAATLVPVTRRLGPAYGVFLLANLLPPLLFGGVLSVGRLTSTLFPVFLWLATCRADRVVGTIALWGIGQGLMATLYFTWRPPY